MVNTKENIEERSGGKWAGVAILSLLLPFVAFYVHQGYVSKHFW
jgi:hypothetical protein